MEDANYQLDQFIPELDCKLGEELLRPTRIYVKPLLSALEKFKLKGMAHITGGGFIENIPRMLPQGLGADIEEGSWEMPAIFNLLESAGKLEREEMYNIFNMGIGMVVAVSSEDTEEIINHFQASGEDAFIIGKVKGEAGITVRLHEEGK